jgi:UDP-glucuronate decarboxylase
MMASPFEVTGPINLGSAYEITMLGLASAIIELTGSRSSLVFGPASPDDSSVRRPDTMRARDLLGWQVTTSLAEGLERTVEYFQARYFPEERS